MGMGATQTMKKDVEIQFEVIKQLKDYRELSDRLKVLNKQSIGMGMHVDFKSDDKLQDLHRKLKPLPTYMYLTKKEQELETIAHAYLPQYSNGIKSQLNDIKNLQGNDDEDGELLKELTRKIKKVREARRGEKNGIDKILDRMAEIQYIETEMKLVEDIFSIMDERTPQYTELLKLIYINKETIVKSMRELRTSRTVFFQWQNEAIKKYAQLAGIF